MLNKKLLFGLITFTLLPIFSPSASIADNDNNSDLMYFRLGYKISNIEKQKIDNAKDVVIASLQKTLGADYDPKYDVNFYAGAIAFGKYFTPNTRAELEIATNFAFNLQNQNKFVFFAFADNFDNGNNVYLNKGFSFSNAALNLYYDVNTGINGFSPYIGGGIGLARMNFMSHPTKTTITYPVLLQLKAGLQVRMNDVIPFYVGYNFSYILEKESSKIKNTVGDVENNKLVAIKASYMLHDVDVGFMIVK